MNKSQPQLFVYRASAGSGKTFTLAARFIALMLDGCSFREILAVTFTNKATTEMKQRILNYLFSISNGSIDKKDSFLCTVTDFMTNKDMKEYKKIQTRAKDVLYDILNDYDHFSICTIDSYLQLLLKGLARHLKLRANFEVDLNEKQTVEEAVDTIVTNFSEEPDAIKEHIMKFVREKIENEDGWDIRKQLKNLCKELSKEPFQLNKTKINENMVNVDTYKKEMETLKNSGELKKMRELLKEFITKYGEEHWMKYDKNIKSYIRNLSDSLDSKITSGASFFKPLATSVVEALKSETTWADVSTNSETAQTSAKILRHLEELLPSCKKAWNSINLSKQYLNELYLLDSISQKVEEKEMEQNSTLLSMTPITLHNELKTGDAFFIMEQSGIRFKHIMIDEFQDTSTLQWCIFIPLIQEIIAQGGTSLIVGDTKQSIYRWRNSNWDILNNIENSHEMKQYFTLGQGYNKNLNCNFRSHRNIVEFNINLFNDIANNLVPDTELKNIYSKDNYNEHNLDKLYCNDKKDGYVQIKFYPYSSTERNKYNPAIIQDMLDEIVMLVNSGTKMQNITILVRKNKEATEIVNFLDLHRNDQKHPKYKDLLITSSEAYLLKASISVNILINALRYLAQPHNNIALFYLAFHYCNDVLEINSDWEKIRKVCLGNPTSLLPRELIERKELLQLPFYEMIERLAQILLYTPERERKLKDDSFVFCFFDEVLNFLKNNPSDIQLFVDYWDKELYKKPIPSDDTKGIQILSIHKAKGLENDIIFLPFCDWEMEDSKGKDKLWCTPNEEPFNHLPILPIQCSNAMHDSIYKNDYIIEHHKQRIDNINLLYVALTRARKELRISSRISISQKNKSDSFSSVAHVLENHMINLKKLNEADLVNQQNKNKPENPLFTIIKIGKPPIGNKTENNNENSIQVIPFTLHNYNGRYKFRQSHESYNFLFPNNQKDKELTQRGQLLHSIYAAINTTDDTNNVLTLFRQQGLIESAEKEEELRNIIHNSWKNKDAAAWFDGSWTLYRECTILDKDGNGKPTKHRPDRVMTRGDETVIIDFKFGQPSEKYAEQIKCYMHLLDEMGYKNINGFLWYIRENTSNIVKI